MMSRHALVTAAWIASWMLLSPTGAESGTLEPPGPPGPTMRTLEELLPSWFFALDSTDGEVDGCNSSRFKCGNGGTVLDLETGLAWQRALQGAAPSESWEDAQGECFNQLLSRAGFRLPAADELASLWTSSGTLHQPPGHPFTNWISGEYWTATSGPEGPGDIQAWAVSFDNDADRVVLRFKSSPLRYFCVRGVGR